MSISAPTARPRATTPAITALSSISSTIPAAASTKKAPPTYGANMRSIRNPTTMRPAIPARPAAVRAAAARSGVQPRSVNIGTMCTSDPSREDDAECQDPKYPGAQGGTDGCPLGYIDSLTGDRRPRKPVLDHGKGCGQSK